MKVTLHKHFDYLTPFGEAENDHELEKIMRLKYPKACSNLKVDAGFFARMVEDVRKFKAWRVIGFDCFEDFCREKLGKTLDEVESIVAGVKILQASGKENPTEEDAKRAVADIAREAKPLKTQGGDRRSEAVMEAAREAVPLKQVNQGSNTTLKHGRDADYLTARIARDRPDILDAMKAGKYKSVRQAALAAGIVKPSFQCPINVERAARLIAKHFTEEECAQIKALL